MWPFCLFENSRGVFLNRDINVLTQRAVENVSGHGNETMRDVKTPPFFIAHTCRSASVRSVFLQKAETKMTASVLKPDPKT